MIRLRLLLITVTSQFASGACILTFFSCGIRRDGLGKPATASRRPVYWALVRHSKPYEADG